MEGKAETGSTSARHLAHLGHELRSPLTAIIGYADAMRAGVFGPLDPRYTEFAEMIEAAGRHMLALAEELLDRAGADNDTVVGPFAVFDAAEAVAWASRLLRRQAETAGVTLACAATSVMVRADRGAIVRMAINLLTNAIRSTPSGGTIRVSLDDGDGVAILRVIDSGPGMAPGSEGRGLGLALVRGLVEAHGGAMTITGSTPTGTEVAVVLPILETPA